MVTKRIVKFTRGGGDWEANGSRAKTYKSEFERDSGEYDVHFEVGTPTGRYEFTKDPIWIKEIKNSSDEDCPTSFGCRNVFSCTQESDFVLVLHNKNNEKNPTDYRYQLNVWDRHAEEYVTIDPILSNGGRGT